MKMFLIKLLTTLAVFLTMYISIVIVNDDTVENTDEIITLNRTETSASVIVGMHGTCMVRR